MSNSIQLSIHANQDAQFSLVLNHGRRLCEAVAATTGKLTEVSLFTQMPGHLLCSTIVCDPANGHKTTEEHHSLPEINISQGG